MSGTTVCLLRSTDTGAPVLNGVAGSCVAVLDACLKDGYNSHTNPVFTRVGSTVTVTYATAHGYAADGLSKIQVSGCVETEYNGIFTPFNVTTLTFDYTITGTPDTPATGTRITKVAPCGWSKAFAGTNKAAYRGNEVTGTRLYLRVDDANPHANGSLTAKMVGYETMSDVDTGTGLFPTVLQIATGVWCNKSDVSSSAAKEWLLVGDGFEFHFFMRHAANCAIPVYRQFHFGDPCSEMASDPYGCLIYGDFGTASSWPYTNNETMNIVSAISTTQGGHYYARAYTQTAAAVSAGKIGNQALQNNLSIGAGGLAYPAPHNNGLYIAPLFMVESSIVRAQLKGIWQPLHLRPLGHGTVLAANVSPIARRLYAVRTTYSNSNNDGETHLDIDGPWR